jgi:L-fucose mutarotase/ribose pyranase (RbsD/FucU family)
MKPGVAPVVSELDRNILTVKEALEVLQKVTKQISKEMQGYVLRDVHLAALTRVSFHDRAKQALSQKRRDGTLSYPSVVF